MRCPAPLRAALTGVCLPLLTLLPAAAAATPTPPAPTTVGIDMGALSERDYAIVDGLALQKKAVLRLVEEGFAVVAWHKAPAVKVRLSMADGVLAVEAVTEAGRERRLLPRGEDEISAFHLEAAHHVVGAVRAAALALSLLKRRRPPPAAVEAAAREPRARDRVEVDVSVLAVVREAADAQPQLGLRLPLGAGWWLDADAGLALASEARVSGRDWLVTLGASRRWVLAGGFELSVGARVGVVLHEFEVQAAAGEALTEPSGLRADFVALAPLTWTWWFDDGFGLRVSVAPGAAHRPREHTQRGEVLWERSAWRVDAGGGLAARF